MGEIKLFLNYSLYCHIGWCVTLSLTHPTYADLVNVYTLDWANEYQLLKEFPLLLAYIEYRTTGTTSDTNF